MFTIQNEKEFKERTFAQHGIMTVPHGITGMMNDPQPIIFRTVAALILLATE